MIQTNRGCPFTCTFCVDGADTVNRVNQFGLDRVSSELNYIGEHVTNNIHSLHISDLNFGMYPRDLEICDGIVGIQKKYDYPHGTGHGVGNYLSVHEGPITISKKSTTKFKKGMILTNEPGFYKVNQYGIRIENVLLVIRKNKFLRFEVLTFVPIDIKLIDVNLLNIQEKKLSLIHI